MENLWNTTETFGISLNQKQLGQLKAHYQLLSQWNRTHNLTTIENDREIFLYHYLDSLLGLKMLPESFWDSDEPIYDLGSGAGFPGLMAAVLWPHRKIVLVESSKKKCSFLTLAASIMGLNRVKVVSQRVETLENINRAITRAAFSPENWPILNSSLGKNAQIAFWLSLKTLDSVRNISNLSLEQESTYKLEPGHQRQIALFVSRGT